MTPLLQLALSGVPQGPTSGPGFFPLGPQTSEPWKMEQRASGGTGSLLHLLKKVYY